MELTDAKNQSSVGQEKQRFRKGAQTMWDIMVIEDIPATQIRNI